MKNKLLLFVLAIFGMATTGVAQTQVTSFPFSDQGTIGQSPALFKANMCWGASNGLLYEIEVTEPTTVQVDGGAGRLAMFLYDSEWAPDILEGVEWMGCNWTDDISYDLQPTFHFKPGVKYWILNLMQPGVTVESDFTFKMTEVLAGWPVITSFPYHEEGIIGQSSALFSANMCWGAAPGLLYQIQITKPNSNAEKASGTDGVWVKIDGGEGRLAMFIFDTESQPDLLEGREWIGCNWSEDFEYDDTPEWFLKTGVTYFILHLLQPEITVANDFTFTLSDILDDTAVKELGDPVKVVKAVRYFDLLGRAVKQDATGFVLKQIIYEDNTSKTVKTFVKR
jgi:hypothetical protein